VAVIPCTRTAELLAEVERLHALGVSIIFHVIGRLGDERSDYWTTDWGDALETGQRLAEIGRLTR
jgi:hypothetical protein